MKKVFLLTVLCLLLKQEFASANNVDISPCIQQNWPSCAGSVGKLIHIVWKLHRWSSGSCVRLGPYTCSAHVKGRIRKLKWVWDGKFRCPHLTGVVGTSSGFKSRTGAVEHAMKNFFMQVSSGYHLSAEQWQQISVGPSRC